MDGVIPKMPDYKAIKEAHTVFLYDALEMYESPGYSRKEEDSATADAVRFEIAYREAIARMED